MAAEYKIYSKKAWSTLRPNIISAIKKHSLFTKEYDYNNRHIYELRLIDNRFKMPEIELEIQEDGLYICRYDLNEPFLHLDSIKKLFDEAGEYVIQEIE